MVKCNSKTVVLREEELFGTNSALNGTLILMRRPSELLPASRAFGAMGLFKWDLSIHPLGPLIQSCKGESMV